MKILKSLLNPSRKKIFLFLFPITGLLLYYLYTHAFDWIIGVRFYIKLMLIFLAGVSIVFFIIDYIFKTAIKKYALAALSMWLVIGSGFFLFKSFIEKQSENRAQVIIDKVEQFKNVNGNYPLTLNDTHFSDLPLRSFTGSFYYYNNKADSNNSSKYDLYYYSFNGREAHYRNKTKMWDYYLND